MSLSQLASGKVGPCDEERELAGSTELVFLLHKRLLLFRGSSFVKPAPGCLTLVMGECIGSCAGWMVER